MFSSDVVPYVAGFPFPNGDGVAIAPHTLVMNNSGNLLKCTATGQSLGVNSSRIYATSEVGTVCPLVPGVIYEIVAAGAISQYADVWQAADGEINDVDNGEGRFGIAWEAASGDQSIIKVMYLPESFRAGQNLFVFDGATGTNELRVPDNLADALSFENATGTTLMQLVTTTGSEAFHFGVDGTGIDVVFYGDTASESLTWDQSVDDLIMTAAVRIVGQGSTVVPLMPIAAQQALSGAGAVTITEYYTAWTTTGASAGTLADGAQVGQLKKIQLIVDAGDGTLTPTNLSGGTTITFADAGDYAILCWDGSNWVAIELGNDADGATAPVLA